MRKTLRSHLEKELRATSKERTFNEALASLLGADVSIRECFQEDFELKYGLIAPVEETIGNAIKEYYASKKYSYINSFYEGSIAGIFGNRVKNYQFSKENSEIVVRTIELPRGEKLLVSVLSAPGFLSPQRLENEVEQRQN